MTYDELSHRCRRIIGLSPESTHSPLDCLGFLSNFRGTSRVIAAESMARELAEFVVKHHSCGEH